MKERAGVVGRGRVADVLTRVKSDHPDLRVHLVGHSFGGRLVTAAVSTGRFTAGSLALLQAAFSHYGFAERWDGAADGLFRPMVTGGHVSGPVIITCTRNDNAVGRAYPIASQIARQTASWLGDKNDKYGGIGSNGAQKTPEAIDARLLPVGGVYDVRPGRLYNLLADDFITDHSAVTGPEVAYAVLTALRT
jgi:pimeloyl-ACP methyl ester carboxylesterase